MHLNTLVVIPLISGILLSSRNSAATLAANETAKITPRAIAAAFVSSNADKMYFAKHKSLINIIISYCLSLNENARSIFT